MRRAALPAFLLLLSGCSLAFGGAEPGEDDGGELGVGGSAPVAGTPAGQVPAADPQEVSQLDSTCPSGEPSRVTLAPMAAGGLGSVQYSASSLAAGRWPDGSSLAVDDFRAFFSDTQPLSDPELTARFTLSSPTEGVLSLRFRLPPPASREPMHIVAVADVSLSAADLGAFREAVLADLAVAVDKADGDRLSLVTFGDAPEVLFDAPVAEAEKTLKNVTGDKGLPSKDGNNLAAAIERAQALLDGERGHIVVLSDGGQGLTDTIAAAVDGARSKGHLVSAIQFAGGAANDSNPDAALFYNGALLSALATRGGGSHLYADQLLAADGPQTALAARYEELFPIAARQVSVTVTLPPGITSTAPPPETGEGGAGVSVSAIRGFGVELPVSGCPGAFATNGEVASELLVTVQAGPDALIDRQSVTFVSAISSGIGAPTLDDAIVAVVTALRQREVDVVKAAFELVISHRTLVCAQAGAASPACAVAQELEAFFHGVCSVVPASAVTVCDVD